jgi:hypothetical protein
MSLNFNEIINPIPGLASGTAKPGRFIYVNVGNKIVKCRAGNEILTKKVTVVRNESGEYIAFSEVGNKTLSTRTTEFFKSRNTTAITAIGFPIKILFSILKNGIYYFYIGGDRTEPELIYELDEKNEQIDIWWGNISNIGNTPDDWIVLIQYTDNTIKDIWTDSNGNTTSVSTEFLIRITKSGIESYNHASLYFMTPCGNGWSYHDWISGFASNRWDPVSRPFNLLSTNTLYQNQILDDEDSLQLYFPIELINNPVNPFVPIFEYITDDLPQNYTHETLRDYFTPFCNGSQSIPTLGTGSLTSFQIGMEEHTPKENEYWLEPDNSFIQKISNYPRFTIGNALYKQEDGKLARNRGFQLLTDGNRGILGSSLGVFNRFINSPGGNNVSASSFEIYTDIIDPTNNYKPFYILSDEGLSENKLGIKFTFNIYRFSISRVIAYPTTSGTTVTRENTQQQNSSNQLININSPITYFDYETEIAFDARYFQRTEIVSNSSNNFSNSVSSYQEDFNIEIPLLVGDNIWIRHQYIHHRNNTTDNINYTDQKYYFHDGETITEITDWSNYPYKTTVATTVNWGGGTYVNLWDASLLQNSIYLVDYNENILTENINLEVEQYVINNGVIVAPVILSEPVLSLKVGEDDIPYFTWWSSSYYS